MEVKGFQPGRAPGVAEFEVDGLKIFASNTLKEQWRPMSECLQTFEPDWVLICEVGVLLLAIAQEYDPSRIVLVVQSTVTHLPTESSGDMEAHRAALRTMPMLADIIESREALPG
jgi:hypothetical protein